MRRAVTPLRLVIFDVDGTLVDSQHHIVAAQARAFAANGLPAPSRMAALSVVGLSLPEAFRTLVGPEGPVEGLCRAYRDAWTALRRSPGFSETLYPGAAETVRDLAARTGTRLAIATGKSRAGVERLLDAQRWHGVFATIQTADDHPSKPDPSMIRAALADTGAAADSAVMIGDTSFDMAMARTAGVRALGVAWGYHDASALVAAGAERVVGDFANLRGALGLPA